MIPVRISLRWNEEYLWIAVAMLVLVMFCRPVEAVTVFVRETRETVRGYLVDVNDRKVIVDEVLPDGSTRRRLFDRATVDVYEKVKPERLEALNSEHPADYRAYADELSEAQADPDARRTALRLYLIAAYLDPQGLGRGSLVAMAALASTPEEVRRYLAMGYLLDPARDRTLLKSPAARKDRNFKAAPNTELLSAGLRAFWSGRKAMAARYAEREDFKRALAPYSATLTADEFREAARSRGESLPAGAMRKVVRLALLISGHTTDERPSSTDPAEPTAWSQLDWKRPAALTSLSLETITPFDPRDCHFRAGKWVP